MREILHNILLFLALTKPRGMLCPNGTVKPFLVSLVEPVAYLNLSYTGDVMPKRNGQTFSGLTGRTSGLPKSELALCLEKERRIHSRCPVVDGQRVMEEDCPSPAQVPGP